MTYTVTATCQTCGATDSLEAEDPNTGIRDLRMEHKPDCTEQREYFRTEKK